MIAPAVYNQPMKKTYTLKTGKVMGLLAGLIVMIGLGWSEGVAWGQDALAAEVVAPVAPTLTSIKLTNPIGETDPRLILGNLVKAIFSIVGSLALLMVVYGGVLWITSRGETKQVQKGKDILTWCFLGLVIMTSAYVIINAVITGLTTGSVSG